MASLTMTASFLGAARPSSVNRRSLVAAKAATGPQEAAPAAGSSGCEEKRESNSRRGMMFAAAAGAICAVGMTQSMAMAEDEPEPKPGTPDAKKKYGPVCVTMPTARICHK